MPIDVASFIRWNVVDTCAVWNILSSKTLHLGAQQEGCLFCITEFVAYECLFKPRTRLNPTQSDLMNRLRRAQSSGQFKSHSISLDDLLEVELLEKRRNLGKGELTTIAFAKTTQQAVLSDDGKARKLAAEVLGPVRSQTTCHLFGWMFFIGRLIDHECELVISEHEECGGDLRPHLMSAYAMGMRARLHALPS
jgi:hypothetical protein